MTEHLEKDHYSLHSSPLQARLRNPSDLKLKIPSQLFKEDYFPGEFSVLLIL